MKQIKIDDCENCTFSLGINNGDIKCSKSQRKVDVSIGIPDWCPLEDADKGTCKWSKVDVSPVEFASHIYLVHECTEYPMGMTVEEWNNMNPKYKYCPYCSKPIEVVE